MANELADLNARLHYLRASLAQYNSALRAARASDDPREQRHTSTYEETIDSLKTELRSVLAKIDKAKSRVEENEPEDLSAQVDWEGEAKRNPEQEKEEPPMLEAEWESKPRWQARRAGEKAWGATKSAGGYAAAGAGYVGRGALGAGRGLMGAASAVPKPTGRGLGLIIGAIVVLFVLLSTAFGTYVSGIVEKGTTGVKPAVEVGANIIKQGLNIIEKGPSVELGGAQSTEETKREDRGIKITNLRASRTLYESPSVVEIEGAITAIGSGDRQLVVKVEAGVKDDVWQALGLTGSLPMVCQIQGGRAGYSAKVKASELNNRLFRCSTCETTSCACDKNVETPQPGCFQAKTIIGKAKPGAINSLSVDVHATMQNTNTWSTRTIYFSTNDLLFKTKDPATEFGITERGSKQQGDDTIEVEVGVPGNPAAIAVTEPGVVSIRGYSLYIRASNPITSTGLATVSSVYLALESPPVEILDSGDFIETTEVPQEFLKQFDNPGAYRFYKATTGYGEIKTEPLEYSLKFEVLKDALGNGRYGTFIAKAYAEYSYKTSKSTTIQIRALRETTG